MDVSVQNLRGNPHGNDGAVRPGGEPGSLEAFSVAEKELFRVAPIEEVERHLLRIQALFTELGVIARTRRQTELGERCAICNNVWKLKLPDGGKVPYASQLLHAEDKSTVTVYACDAACYSKLQFAVEKRTFSLRKQQDDEREEAHRYSAKKPRKL